MRIGILTGGGDAPGLNAVIRGLTLRAHQMGHEVVGIQYGWKGILERKAMPLSPADVRGLQSRGGTILRSSRTNPTKDAATIRKAVEGYKALHLDALVGVGGDDTLGALSRLATQGLNAIGVPKTIDNDIKGTDVTFGYDTAVNIAADAIDRLHTTAYSHARCLVVEIMGRHAGWITWAAGVAAGAHVILVPEEPFDIQEVVQIVKARDKGEEKYTIVAVAEGARPRDAEAATKDAKTDEFGNVTLGGIAARLAKTIEDLTGKETRHVVLGHLQRGGDPSAFDRVLGTRLGVEAAEACERRDFGKMLAVRANQIVPVPLSEVEKGYRTLGPEHLKLIHAVRGE
jgi:ATP-dependent phosphofructokinase / diphosphate-dependent phosphofructokinase